MDQPTPQNKYDVFSYTMQKDDKSDFQYGSYPNYIQGKKLKGHTHTKTKRNQAFTRKPFPLK